MEISLKVMIKDVVYVRGLVENLNFVRWVGFIFLLCILGLKDVKIS